MTTAPSKRQMKSAARLYAVQALFQMETSGQTVERVTREFESFRFGEALEDGVEMFEGDSTHFRAIVTQAVNWQAKIDQLTDRALVRAAGAEIVALDTPPKVAITEYVDVAKAFFPEGKEPKFVNAVLDHMAHEAKPEAF